MAKRPGLYANIHAKKNASPLALARKCASLAQRVRRPLPHSNQRLARREKHEEISRRAQGLSLDEVWQQREAHEEPRHRLQAAQGCKQEGILRGPESSQRLN
jgi:hypothetical protein